MARIVAMMVVVALAAMPAGALAGTGEALTPQVAPEQPLLQNQAQEAPQPAPAPAPALPPSEAESRIGPGELVLVALVIVVLLGGIWYAISRDARRATRGRVHPQPVAGEGLGAGGSATRAARRTRKLSAAERRRRKRGRARR
jgi:Tfp pilus assembly protein FimV